MSVEYVIMHDCIIIPLNDGKIVLKMYSNKTISFSYAKTTSYENPCLSQDFIDINPNDLDISSSDEKLYFRIGKISVAYEKKTGKLTFKWTNKELSILNYELKQKEINEKLYTEGILQLSSLESEAYFGLGQHQDHFVNLARKKLNVFHDYKGNGGEQIGIPFLVSSNKYGVIFNTQSQVKASIGITGVTEFIGDCVSDVNCILFFGENNEDIYKSYRDVTGVTPMPLKSSLGYIQSKQRYKNQKEVLNIARKYRESNYPIDMLVVDWFHWKVLGDLSLDSEYWPNPKSMNEELSSLDIDSMISIWPRFMKESKHYNFLEEKGWLATDVDGNIVYGTPDDQRGALIDTTNPECRKWLFDTIYDSYGKDGFNAWWTDENEPDLWPYDFKFDEGMGFEIFNLYPYRHSQSIYEGHRKVCKNRCCTLSRSAYLGAQKFGTQFWSSDVYPTWDVLKRQIPTAINFCATGMGYWSSDIGGWQELPSERECDNDDVSSLLLKTESNKEGSVTLENYPELYIRWFEFSVFCPIFRAHGSREENEIWSYGKEAELILAKFLRLRYKLMPYIYSQAYEIYKSGYPLLRGLFLDFSSDEIATSLTDEYMFGPALLVAPVVVQGETSRNVYLPIGSNWYDFWTNEKYDGGQWISVKAPLDTLPLFVKEDSLIVFGNEVQSTKDEQNIISVRSYTTNSKPFTFYNDDGVTYSYESGEYTSIILQVVDGKLVTSRDSKFEFKLELY